MRERDGNIYYKERNCVCFKQGGDMKVIEFFYANVYWAFRE